MTGNTRYDLGHRPRRWRAIAWGAAALLLATPWVAMQFTTEVNWTVGDFLVLALMLGVAGGGFELALRLSRHSAYRAAAAVALGAAFLLFWANGAVGLIGSENNPANRVFDALLLVPLLGSLLARFRAAGMARAMGATALAQLGVALFAWWSGWGHVWVLTAFFMALWLLAAGLFREAAAAPGTAS